MPKEQLRQTALLQSIALLVKLDEFFELYYFERFFSAHLADD